MSLLHTYRALGPAVRLTEPTARAIVEQAMPHALAALGRPASPPLPVRVRCVEPAQARGGSLVPAWPLRQTDGTVTIEYVADWGALLAGWLATVGPPRRALAEDLVRSGQRLWIGIGNDVVQLFVADPPAGQYSMVRHHALLLAAATAWLGPAARRAWGAAHESAAEAFVGRLGGRPLWAAIEAAERGLDRLAADPRAQQPAAVVLDWLDEDRASRAAYVDYLAAASLGVAAVLEAMPPLETAITPWLVRAMAALHPAADFNRTWIEATVRRLGSAQTVPA